MAQYKYYLEMNYINGETNLEIKPENIKQFFIDSNYEQNHMSMMYAVLHIDKNFYDEIITNAKTATIITNIYKILADDETETKILTDYNGECSYFISGDINYNKEIDYATTSDDSTKREDIYKQVHMGLIYKECIENNKQTNNTTIKNTTMINAVASYASTVPLLIENFTYNDIIQQLVVPPQDSLYKTVNFFNSIKVFYDTPYRFFIEPGCVYLISSSGKSVQKASEKYSTVIFNIHAITAEDANVLGMEEDNTNNCYRVDVNVLDTHYTIDNDTCKTVNNIRSIINPSKNNSLIALGDITKAMKKVDDICSNVLSSITKQIGTLSPIPSAISKYKLQFSSSTEEITNYTNSSSSLINDAITIIEAVPETQPPSGEGESSPPVKTMTPLEKSTIIAKLNADREILLNNTIKFNNLNSDFAKSSSNLMGCLSKTTTNIPSLINSIKSINITDNISYMKNLTSSIKNQNLINKNFTQNTLMPYISTGQSIVSTMQTIIAELTALGVIELEDTIKALQSNLDGTKVEVDLVTSSLNSYKSFPTNIGTVHSNIAPQISKFDTLDVNLKQQFTRLNMDIQNISGSTQNTLSSLINASSSVDSLKTKGLSLTSIKDLATNINSIKDISQIGKIGVSKFNVGLNFMGEGNIDNPGNKIVRINNDNANKIKNIKAKMETKANKLTLNKNDLDTSVFTINKEYIVKNYDAHSNKDGRFLLNRKVEIFLRQDDKFLLNIMLEFDKLADVISTSGVAELGKSVANTNSETVDTNKIIDNAASILDTIKTKGLTKNTIESVAKDGSAITKEYKKMGSSNKSNTTLSSVIERLS